MDLSTPLDQIPKIGTYLTDKLKRLKLNTVEDLINHYPFRYEDLGQPKNINEINTGEIVATQGKVLQIKNIRTRFGKKLTLATINDGFGSIEAIWFNQPFLTKNIKTNDLLAIAGKVGLFSHRQTFINPSYELVTNTGEKRRLHTKGLIPIYPETSGLSSRWFRQKIKDILPQTLNKIRETLPNDTLQRNKIITKKQASWQIHFPKNDKEIKDARKRLAYEEILISILNSFERKSAWQQNRKGVPLKKTQEKILNHISTLPFELTKSQNKVLREIFSDLSSHRPVNRLFQGDVGSGKTVVAAIAAYAVYLNGFKSALMAPTEILAMQHLNTLKSILSPYGVKVAIRTSQIKNNGEYDILIGTHALLTKDVKFKNLAFTVIDEQHRFGVEQRALLRTKGKSPHVLSMTASPIPRSLALTFYGDLDVSNLTDLPRGRKKIDTFIVPLEKRGDAYQFIQNKIGEGNQAFIICPIIEPSESLITVKAAKVEYERLKNEIFPQLSLGLMHGRLKIKEKEEVITKFLENKINILVSTPLVEVGIDILNETIMMMEAAERFGLASLHQLRGRVGRSSKQSYCLLFTENTSEQVKKRLNALVRYNNGLKLAEIDLELRGPGQLYGTEQSGLLDFKIATLSDLPLIAAVRKEAEIIYNLLKKDSLPLLSS